MNLRLACALLMLLSPACFAAEPSEAVKAAVQKMPPHDSAQESELAAELLKLGPPALREVCAMLIPLGNGDDTKARMAVTAVARHAKAGQRPLVANALGETLSASTDNEVRAFLVQHLQLVGGDESVPRLAPLLTHEALSDPAAAALTAIGTKAAQDALLTALSSSSDRRAIPLIKALGTLRTKAAAPHVLKHAGSDDADLRNTALYALANIAPPEARAVLAKASSAADPTARSRGTSLYLLYARRLAEDGDAVRAEQLTRELMKSRSGHEDAYVRAAGLSTLVAVRGAAALDDLLAASTDPNEQIRFAALDLAAQVPGQPATEKWIARLKSAADHPQARAEILAMLGRRGDASAVTAIRDAIKDEEEAVRAAAIGALAKLSGDAAIADLIGLVKTGQPGHAAATTALASLKGDRVLAAVAEAIPGTPPTARIALLDILASRVARAHIDTVIAQATSDDPAVRKAALAAFGKLASEAHLPRLVQLAAEAKTDGDREAALNALVAAAQKLPDADRRSAPLLAAMSKADAPQRAAFLRTLPRLPGPAALAAVVADLPHAEASVRDAALRALAAWPDAAAIAPLTQAAKDSQDLTHHALAVRAAARLLSASKLDPKEEAARYKALLDVSRRPDEKKIVLASLATERGTDALALAALHLDDQELGPDASLAAIRIALPAKSAGGLKGPDIVEALTKAIPLCPDAQLKRQAEDYLKTISNP